MKIVSISLILIGILIVIYSDTIVFPYLERIVGIETIVGHHSVLYDDPNDPESDYMFTNPTAMIKWTLSVKFLGLMLVGFATFNIRKINKKETI